MGANNGIIKGAETFFIEGNEIGLLISHGFMGTPQSVRFIGEQLANDIKDRSVYEITYDQAPLHAIHELQKLMASTPAILKSIHCPTLGIKSAIDHVVPPQNTDFILANIEAKNKQLIVLENSYHVASMDFDKMIIVESCHRFVQDLLQQKKQAI